LQDLAVALAQRIVAHSLIYARSSGSDEMKTILIFIDYFGRWPDWFDVFLESCRNNPTIDWCIHTDCDAPDEYPANVRFIKLTFDDYCAHASALLGVRFRPTQTYNICNLKPMFGYLYRDIAKRYDFYGWGDLDVIYGNLRSFLSPPVLSHNLISTHSHICSGHLTLVRSEARLHEAFRQLTVWEERLEDPGPFQWHQSLAESGLTALFSPNSKTREHCVKQLGIPPPPPIFHHNNYFIEQWSTPFTPRRWVDGTFRHPERWQYSHGVLTNERNRKRSFMYLHLMNFSKKTWINTDLYGHVHTWSELPHCLRLSTYDLRVRRSLRTVIQIDRRGFYFVT
jgi:hypothetical protein